MATHTVRGTITYPFEVEVELTESQASELSVRSLLDTVGARDGYGFGRLAFNGDDIWVQDHEARVAITEVVPGGIVWEEDDEPATGVADGAGGIVSDAE